MGDRVVVTDNGSKKIEKMAKEQKISAEEFIIEALQEKGRREHSKGLF